MRFARLTFVVAGIWGIVVLTPLYWLFDLSGRAYGPPGDYPTPIIDHAEERRSALAAYEELRRGT